ncbi:MAG: hypothetical protein AAFO93_16135, partial [Pseudomonadota bacterium]
PEGPAEFGGRRLGSLGLQRRREAGAGRLGQRRRPQQNGRVSETLDELEELAKQAHKFTADQHSYLTWYLGTMLLDDSYKLKYKRAVNSTEITLYLGEPEVVQGDKKKLDFFGNNLYQANITNLTNVVKVGIKVQMEHKADVVSYQNTEIGQNRKLSQREEGDFLMKLKGELDE